MLYRENAFGLVEIVTPMGTITLSGQNVCDGALEETEDNLAVVLKDLKFERQDKRRILGSLRKNLLHFKNERAAMAKQHVDDTNKAEAKHMKDISEAKEKYNALQQTFTNWRTEEHVKSMNKDTAVKEAHDEVNLSVKNEAKLRQKYDEEVDRVKRRDATIESLE